MDAGYERRNENACNLRLRGVLTQTLKPSASTSLADHRYSEAKYFFIRSSPRAISAEEVA